MPEQIGPIVETKAFEQLGLLVLDGSGSMKDEGETKKPKADEVSTAVRGLVARLKASRMKNNFQLAMLTYDDKVTERISPTPVSNLDETADYNPLVGHGEWTAIGEALYQAGKIADQFVSQETPFPRSAVIVLMTDGKNNKGRDPVEAADLIKKSGKKS